MNCVTLALMHYKQQLLNQNKTFIVWLLWSHNERKEEMKINKDISQALINGIRHIVKREIKDSDFDKTYEGIITDYDSTTNSYDVLINGKSFVNTKSSKQCVIGEKVSVLFPQNKSEKRFIIYGWNEEVSE